jgi:glycosyltransferase involved in cell wall biosynthesis
VTVLTDNSHAASSGFCSESKHLARSVHARIHSFSNNKFFYQSGIFRYLLTQRPDVVISFANPRFISYWISLLLCRVLDIRFYSHGQGLYSYPLPGRLRTMIYLTMVALSTRYICYTELSRASMLAIGCNPMKLAVADNSVSLTATVMPNKKNYMENGVLFVGRLREDCRLELLVTAIRDLRNICSSVVLHVIGSGVLADHYKAEYFQDDWILWHGAIHDDARIAEISLDCRIGCYPGDAGLSVVHMFGLSLPQLVHGSIAEHMGPEPSYVIDGDNGFLFEKSDAASDLTTKLKKIWAFESNELKTIGQRAYQTYLSLNNPVLGERFLQILAEDEFKQISCDTGYDK